MKQQPAPRTHTPDEPPPVTIHHAEEDTTLLARWLARAAGKGPSFWMMVAGLLAVVFAVGYLVNGMLLGKSAASDAWSKVLLANSPQDLREIAASEESTPAAGWALLAAASENYGDALKRLPADRDSALPLLTQSFDTYKQVADASENDTDLRRMAVLGMARSKEARGELDEAIAHYERVAKEWPGSDDARRAEARVKRLNTAEAKEFYQQFAVFKPKTNPGVLPPRGSARFDTSPFAPSLPPGHPPMDGPTIPAPGLGSSPPIPFAPPAEMPRTPAESLPTNPFAPADAPPKAEPAKPPELPTDPFAPPK